MDPVEFRSLVETHQRMVFSLALRLTGEYGTAEEVAQDAFLDLFRSTQSFKSQDHIRFWLRRTTLHRATDALRRRSRRPEANAEIWDEECHSETTESDSSEAVESLEARLGDLLQALPESMRVPVVFRYQEEMQPQEIAELLGQPLATVKSNLQRGLRLLRKKASIAMREHVL